jgi:molybdopterin/thiamine biosynthesis adenylyltransferase
MDITRFRDICNTDEKQMSVTVIGAGSLGSNVIVLLARLGLKDITVYDDDVVESHNLGHQAYREIDTGTPKSESIFDIVYESTGTKITPVNKRTDGKGISTDILILATDSMASRKEIASNAEYQFIIDGRMGGETFNIYTASGLDKTEYEKTLYTDEEARELTCGGRSIGYTSYLAAGLVVNQVKKLLNGEDVSPEINFCSKTMFMEVANIK